MALDDYWKTHLQQQGFGQLSGGVGYSTGTAIGLGQVYMNNCYACYAEPPKPEEPKPNLVLLLEDEI